MTQNCLDLDNQEKNMKKKDQNLTDMGNILIIFFCLQIYFRADNVFFSNQAKTLKENCI